MKTCPQCGETFTPRSNRQVYCTKACRKGLPKTLTCEVCGKEFPRVRQRAACCSDACRYRRHYLREIEIRLARATAWRLANPERRRAHARAYNARHRDALSVRRAIKVAAGGEEMRARNAEVTRRWRAANRRAVRAIEWRRRHAIRDHPDTRRITAREWADLVNRHGGRCAYCQTPSNDLHLDHVVPVSRGGRHGIGNALPVCQECNQLKTAFLLIEWRIRCRKIGRPLPGIGDLAATSARSQAA